jgi:hypothetical protein
MQLYADTCICVQQPLIFIFLGDCSFDEMAVGSYHTCLAQPVAALYEEPAKLWELQDTPNSALVTNTDVNSAAALLPLPPPRRRRGQLPPQLSVPSTELIDMTADQSMSTEDLLDTSAEALLPTSIGCSLTGATQQQQPQQPQQQQQQQPQRQSDWCADWSAQLQEVVDSVAQSKKRRSSSSAGSADSTTAAAAAAAAAAVAATAALQHNSRKRNSSSASTSDSSSDGSSAEQSSDSCSDYYYSAPSTLSVQDAAVSSSKRQCLDRSMQVSAGHVYAVNPEQWQGKLWITKAELLQQCPIESVERVYTLTGS